MPSHYITLPLWTLDILHSHYTLRIDPVGFKLSQFPIFKTQTPCPEYRVEFKSRVPILLTYLIFASEVLKAER
jgi:hypothetical protein